MTLSIHPLSRPNPAQIQELQTLSDQTTKVDGLMPKIYFDCIQKRSGELAKDFFYYDDDRLIAYLGLFEFQPHELEACIVVHPDYRRQGLLSELFKQSKELVLLLNVQSIILACHHDSKPGNDFVATLIAQHSYSEYTMALADFSQYQRPVLAKEQLTLTRATPEDIPNIARLDKRCFESHYMDVVQHTHESIHSDLRLIWIARLADEVVGKIHIYREKNGGYIHDYCVDPNHQGRGFGTEILVKTLELLQQLNFSGITLDVKCHNESAIKIYQRQGFSIESVYDFWKIMLDEKFMKRFFYRGKSK